MLSFDPICMYILFFIDFFFLQNLRPHLIQSKSKEKRLVHIDYNTK